MQLRCVAYCEHLVGARPTSGKETTSQRAAHSVVANATSHHGTGGWTTKSEQKTRLHLAVRALAEGVNEARNTLNSAPAIIFGSCDDWGHTLAESRGHGRRARQNLVRCWCHVAQGGHRSGVKIHLCICFLRGCATRSSWGAERQLGGEALEMQTIQSSGY